MNLISKLFEGEFKRQYWDFLNKFSEPQDGCLCTMREECRSCYTSWQKRLAEKPKSIDITPEVQLNEKQIEDIERRLIFLSTLER